MLSSKINSGEINCAYINTTNYIFTVPTHQNSSATCRNLKIATNHDEGRSEDEDEEKSDAGVGGRLRMAVGEGVRNKLEGGVRNELEEGVRKKLEGGGRNKLEEGACGTSWRKKKGGRNKDLEEAW